MIARFLEIRDEGTCIPILAIKMLADPILEPIAHRFLGRSGYSPESPSILVIKLNSPEANYNPHKWAYARTMTAAHKWLRAHFDEVIDGQVVDVRVILGEADTSAEAEIWTAEKAASCA